MEYLDKMDGYDAEASCEAGPCLLETSCIEPLVWEAGCLESLVSKVGCFEP